MQKAPTEGNYEIANGEITEGMGPKMRALGNNRMRAFVICLQDGPDLNYTRAAREAGYGGSHPASVRNQAYALAHDPKIIEAIAEEAHRRLNASIGWSVSQLINLGQSSKNDGDKIKALDKIMDRIPGFAAKTEHNVNVKHTDDRRSPKEQLAAFFHVAKQLGIQEPMKLLGHAPVVDAEFKEIDPDEEALGEL